MMTYHSISCVTFMCMKVNENMGKAWGYKVGQKGWIFCLPQTAERTIHRISNNHYFIFLFQIFSHFSNEWFEVIQPDLIIHIHI